MRLGRTASALICALALAQGAPANAQAFTIDIRAGSLAASLQDLARQTGAELLYDRQLVGGFRGQPVRGQFTAQAALSRLLEGTPLTVRRASSGAWVVERPAAEALAQPDVAVSEILVLSKRSQNVDIRRTETDIQPYRVKTGEEIVHAHRDTLDQFFHSREPVNGQIYLPSRVGSGETNSEFDIRGLGSDSTLVLIDGRRMARIPGQNFLLYQPDINGVPLHAIERVETLMGTSGGAYGFGALGGVVNVILKRDYRGAELHATGGLSSRGDAGRYSLEGRIGFTPDGGRTDVMVTFGRTRAQPLRVGQRDYEMRDKITTAAVAPGVLVEGYGPERLGFGNSVGVFSLDPDEKLTFKPAYGGGALGASRTFLPVGFRGTNQDLAAVLTQRAGQFDSSLTEADALSEIGSTPSVDSVIFSGRHRFAPGFEAYVDGLRLRNRGRYSEYGHHLLRYDTEALNSFEAINPFQQDIWVTIPLPLRKSTVSTEILSQRYTAGVVSGLPFGWRGTAEASFGSTLYKGSSREDEGFDSTFLIYPGLGPGLNPLGDWDAFQKAMEGHYQPSTSSLRARNRFDEESLRLAGPVFSLGAQPATLTLLLERRRERTRNHRQIANIEYSSFKYEVDETYRGAATTTASGYAELRAPVFGQSAPLPFLRGLELQLAARRDRLKLEYTRFVSPSVGEFLSGDITLGDGGLMRSVLPAWAYTAGAKVSPVSGLMLRGSYSTGAQAPTLDELREQFDDSYISTTEDPRRGGEELWKQGFHVARLKGSADLKTVRAETLSLGAVVTPLGDRGPKLALDYSVIRKSREVVMLWLREDFVFAHEGFWPERIERAPLTDEDRAKGYTGGKVTTLDLRATNAGRRTVKSLDGRLDWTAPAAGGRLSLYAAASYRMKDTRWEPFESGVPQVGFATNPVRLRANGGADFVLNRTSVGMNVQVFGRYRSYPGELPREESVDEIAAQGSEWIPSQVYFDLYAGRSFKVKAPGGPVVEFNLELAAINVLDKSPPRETSFAWFNAAPSRYGDPRRRRFELVLSSKF